MMCGVAGILLTPKRRSRSEWEGLDQLTGKAGHWKEAVSLSAIVARARNAGRTIYFSSYRPSFSLSTAGGSP